MVPVGGVAVAVVLDGDAWGCPAGAVGVVEMGGGVVAGTGAGVGLGGEAPVGIAVDVTTCG